MGIFNTIGNAFRNGWEKVKNGAKGAWNTIKSGARKGADVGSKTFNVIGRKIKQGADFVYNNIPVIGQVARGVAGGITDNISNGFTNAGNMFGNLRDGNYSEALNNFGRTAGNVASLVTLGGSSNPVVNSLAAAAGTPVKAPAPAQTQLPLIGGGIYSNNGVVPKEPYAFPVINGYRPPPPNPFAGNTIKDIRDIYSSRNNAFRLLNNGPIG